MHQVRPGVYVDDPLPAHTSRVSNDWRLELKIGDDIPLPTAVSVNGKLYVSRKED